MNDTCALSTYRQRTREFYYTPASGKYKDRTPTRLLPIVSWLRCPKPFMTRSWVDVDAARLAMSLVKQGVHFEPRNGRAVFGVNALRTRAAGAGSGARLPTG
jgi:hypothetical protein